MNNQDYSIYQTLMTIVASFPLISEIILNSALILLTCFSKPFVARGWLISTFSFYLFNALISCLIMIFQSSTSHDRASFDLISVLLNLQFILLSFGMFSLLVFFFVYFMKINMNINVNMKEVLLSTSGRLSRKQYWILMLMIMSVAVPLFSMFLSATVNLNYNPENNKNTDFFIIKQIVLCVLSLIPLWFSVVIYIKRFHDFNKTGWFTLVLFIPVVGVLISIFYLGLVRGTEGENKYGDDPLTPNDNLADSTT
ncbi:DUF805 domain-containing protein [uncultured Psychrosphaera sp.]|uniref:DUF805 domain-containing protein n=1 Tax=uncultured Psychrosphaera sp. TaxID=1403522 RepID=UPI00261C0D77|nr:DUF805 domain-containing protein [uncultured Psychrosphaera sp.]